MRAQVEDLDNEISILIIPEGKKEKKFTELIRKLVAQHDSSRFFVYSSLGPIDAQPRSTRLQICRIKD